VIYEVHTYKINFDTLQMLQNHSGRGEPEIEVRMKCNKYELALFELELHQ
jgi:hypothetical protein